MNASRSTARIAGILYVTIIVTGIFAEFFVRQSLVVPGDATATAGNIMAAEGLFRLGIAADLIMIMSDIGLALAFYVLLKPVSNGLSLLAAFFRLVQATILGINLLNLFFVLQLLSGAEMLAAFSAGQLHSLALMFLTGHGIGYSIGLVFFGLSLFVLGYLVFQSGYLPRIFGVLLVVAGSGYVIDSFAGLLLPTYSDFETVFALVVFLPAFIGELAIALWLLFKGVDVPAMETRTLKPASV
jgi:hypothetical protein